MTKNIGIILGSTRKNSNSEAVGKAFAGLFPADTNITYLDIAQLPLYSQDLDDPSLTPTEYTNFRELIKQQDAILFITPEHNRSIPAALKNALDVGSRPYGENAFAGMNAAIVSHSPGAISGFGANHHLRQILVFLGMRTLSQPEAYLGNVNQLVSAEGEIMSDGTKAFFQSIVDAFLAEIDAVTSAFGDEEQAS